MYFRSTKVHFSVLKYGSRFNALSFFYKLKLLTDNSFSFSKSYCFLELTFHNLSKISRFQQFKIQESWQLNCSLFASGSRSPNQIMFLPHMTLVLFTSMRQNYCNIFSNIKTVKFGTLCWNHIVLYCTMPRACKNSFRNVR